MIEKDQAEEIQEETATDEQGVKKPGRKQGVPGSTLESSSAQLPARKTVQVNYQPAPPSRVREEPPEEPPKQAPVVPPGDYEEDVDDSPPVHFDDPVQETTGEETEETAPADDATDTAATDTEKSQAD